MDDFFADLLPSKPDDDQTKAGTSSDQSLQEDSVLPSKLESPRSTVSQSSLDLMSGDTLKSQLVPGQVPMGEPKVRKDLREYQQITQTIVEGALKRFSGDLQRVLEEISRYVWVLCCSVFSRSMLRTTCNTFQASGVSREPDKGAGSGFC